MTSQPQYEAGYAAPVKRPFSVTLLVILTWISAILGVLSGILLLIISFTGDSDYISGELGVGTANAANILRVLGAVYIVVGLITALIASKLAAGSNGARIFLTVLEIITIISSVVAITQGDNSVETSSPIPSLIISAIILVLLWNSKASAFFHQPRR